MTTFAGPWLSPAVVILSVWPKLLPGMGHLNGDEAPDANDGMRHGMMRAPREISREEGLFDPQKVYELGFYRDGEVSYSAAARGGVVPGRLA